MGTREGQEAMLGGRFTLARFRACVDGPAHVWPVAQARSAAPEASALGPFESGSAVRHVAAAFAWAGPFFKIYSVYCQNYETALISLRAIRGQTNFEEFCAGARTDPACAGLPLEALLIKPVQRICKYPLFLTQMRAQVGDEADAAASLARESAIPSTAAQT